MSERRAAGERRRRRKNADGDSPIARQDNQAPFRQPRLRMPPVKFISDDEVEAIHDASLTILEEIGVDFIHPDAKTILKQAGADLDPNSDRVRFDRALITQAMATAPEQVTLHARNPAHTVTIGGDYLAFCPVASPPNCSDMDTGRRTGNRADYRKFLKLINHYNILHMIGGYPVEPVDIHPSIRHLDALSDMATLTDKAMHAYSLGPERIRDGIEIARISHGLTDEEFDQRTSLMTVINTNSPLKLDIPMLGGIMEMSKRNQMVVVTPFTLSGAMAPVTIAGALVQQNAEALAGMAFTQMVNPGAPVVYGGFTSNVDMKSGAPAFGTPEYMKAAIIGGQLARRYKVPYRSSNVCAANSVDAQAAYEAVFSLWGAVMGGVNMLKHGAGWLEGGLCASFEKFVLDIELLQMVSKFLEPLDVGDAALGLDAVREVGPGGHYFGAAHTQERYRDAFYAPMISDWRNFETWHDAGEPVAWQRANAIFKEVLAASEPPPMDPAISEELAAFVARRKEEGGAPTDF